MNVKIIIDSTVDTTPAIRAKCAVVPLTVHFGEAEYVDGVTISHHDFYEKLATGTDLPTTSQPTPDAFMQEFQKVVDAGQKAVVLTVASKLSGTYQSATIAAAEFPGSIYVVDTKTVTIGSGILAELAVNMAEAGASAEDIVKKINAERDNVRLVALVDTLEYLKKGGRISKTVAFAGELLSIKPVIGVQDGEIQILAKARGARQGNAMLSKQIEAMGGVDFSKPIMLGYTGNSNEALGKYVAENAELWASAGEDLPCAQIGSVIGTHAGPGAYAAAFIKK
ncbi:MAG: DegV family protein [Oscillospiraceae bacterium]|nr:DegV family protein [Oscillospiraceae bacterium]